MSAAPGENIKVVVRVRPLNEAEKAAHCRSVVTVDPVTNSVKIVKPGGASGVGDIENVCVD